MGESAWTERLDRNAGGQVVTVDGPARISQLEAALGRAHLEIDFLRSVVEKEFSPAEKVVMIREMDARFASLPLSRRAQLLALNRSLLYRERCDGCAIIARERQVQKRLLELSIEFPGSGYSMLTHHLAREGECVNSKRVRRILGECGLFKHKQRRWARTTDSEHGLRTYPNLTKESKPTGLDQVWVADITFVRLCRGRACPQKRVREKTHRPRAAFGH